MSANDFLDFKEELRRENLLLYDYQDLKYIIADSIYPMTTIATEI